MIAPRRALVLAMAVAGTIPAAAAAAPARQPPRHGQPPTHRQPPHRQPPPAPRAPQTGYLAAPTEQLALPGQPVSGELTPEGDVYTGWAEYEPSIGPRGLAVDQPTRVAPDPGVPAWTARRTIDGVVYREQTFTVPVAGAPVTYLAFAVSNTTSHPVRAQVGLSIADTRGPTVTGFHDVRTGAHRYERPVAGTGDGLFFQLGAAFDRTWAYRAAGRDVDRSGLTLVRGPVGGAARTARAPTPTSVGARQTRATTLRAHGHVTWTWQIPLQPAASSAQQDRALDALSLAAAQRRLRRYWAVQQRGLTAIHVPEQRVDDVYRASIQSILQARYRLASGWVQGVNRFQYQAYWIRDSAIETVALDQAGLHTPAAENLDFLPRWQTPSGEFISRAGQQDGVGQALWELDQHSRLTDDPRYALAQIPRIAAAIQWVQDVTATDPLHLLPPSTIADDEHLVGAHITGDDVWTAVGLRSAVDVAKFTGNDDLAALWQGVDTNFEASLRAAIAADMKRAHHVTPGLDKRGGHDWGNYNLAYPLPILPTTDRAVTATVDWERGRSREGLATYGRLLHDYLAYPIFETELAGGDAADAVRGLYAELAHTTASGGSWEDGPTPYGSRQTTVNLAPHGTAAAQYVSLLRNLLVRETSGGVELLSGASPAWLAPGKVVSVANAPTANGTVSFRLAVDKRGDGATITYRREDRSGQMWWALPYWVRSAHRVHGGGTVRGRVALTGAHGSFALHWTAKRPSQALAQTVSDLNRSYRAHHRAAPLVSARGWN